MDRIHRNRIHLIGLGAALVLCVPSAVRAQTPNAGAPGEWLAQYSSARTLGLGGAFVATADDPLGVMWNPAGLAMMDRDQVSFETARLFEDTSINGFGFAVPGSRFPSLGLSVLSLRSGDFQKTNELNDPLGTFSTGETAYLFTISRAFSPRLSFGANLKMVQQTVESWNGGGFGFDLGGLVAITPALHLGVSAMNLGGPSVKLRDTEEAYPVQWRGGLALSLLGGRALLSAQVDQSGGLGARVHGGTEYWIQPGLALRAGIDQSRGSGGLTYRFTPRYQLDYGVADHPLGMMHRVGISYRFGGYFASSRAEPEAFSPTGERAVTKISLNAHTKDDPDNWTLDILDKSNAVVRRFGGKGQPPAHVEWDGKDETGLPLADGRYRYTLIVRDAEGRMLTSTKRSVEISTSGPQGSVPMVSSQ
jgi:hypothetical protein